MISFIIFETVFIFLNAFNIYENTYFLIIK